MGSEFNLGGSQVEASIAATNRLNIRPPVGRLDRSRVGPTRVEDIGGGVGCACAD